MSDDVSYGALGVPSRRRLLAMLRATDERLDIPSFVAATGLHPNTVRFHLDVLVRAGLVEEHREQRVTRGRPRMLYTPTVPTGQAEGYRPLAEMLVSHLDEAGHAGAAELAGRAWARRTTPTTPAGRGDASTVTRTVVALFSEMGFDPAATAQPGGIRIDLRACPFRMLAEQYQRVVCGLHLGLLRELVEPATAGTVDATLSPFVSPGLCVVHLATTGPPGAA